LQKARITPASNRIARPRGPRLLLPVCASHGSNRKTGGFTSTEQRLCRPANICPPTIGAKDGEEAEKSCPRLHPPPISFPVIIALEYSLVILKSRRRLPECLPVPLQYREALENSPGIHPQRRGSPPHSIPPQPFH